MSQCCLFWVQSLLGSGHLRRALAIAEALAGSSMEVVLANGGLPPPGDVPSGVRLVQLPSITTRGHDFADLIDGQGRPVGPGLWCHRAVALRALLDQLAPTLILTEMFPFGRRAFREELLPALRAARRGPRRPLIASSVRDVLVSKPAPHKYDWMRDTALELYNVVLVHGDPRLFPFGLTFPHAAALGDRLIHTGFVMVEQVPERPSSAAPTVVVSAGGGAVGAELLRAALAARPRTRFAAAPWLLVGGANLPAVVFESLVPACPDGVDLVRYCPDLPALMAAAEVSVSQAGYNTVVEGLHGGARMVLVPFAGGIEDEQTRRARRLEALGLAAVLPETGLDAAALAQAVDRAAILKRPARARFAFDGARTTAEVLHRLLEEHRRAA